MEAILILVSKAGHSAVKENILVLDETAERDAILKDEKSIVGPLNAFCDKLVVELGICFINS